MSNRDQRFGVFISYARLDGSEYAKELRQRLQSEGIRVWQDRIGMEGGRDWWLQITQAIDQAEFLILVLTPAAFQSDTVKREWTYAHQQGVCVYPVKGAPDLNFSSLPRWVRKIHTYDLQHEDEWTKFLHDLNKPCEITRAPVMAQTVPEYTVNRAELELTLRSLIEDDIEPVYGAVALYGTGGYGKTTIAKSISQDERIKDVFSGGVLWVTLGESPGDLIPIIVDLIRVLTDEQHEYSTLEAATTRLSEAIADRDILMIIDDVWSEFHIRPFLAGGSRCTRLITTRNLDTIPPDARKIEVGPMSPAEAAVLLTHGLPEAEGLPIDSLAEQLGRWPLLLRLVNSTMRYRRELLGQTVNDALLNIRQDLGELGLTALDAGRPEARDQAVEKTMQASMNLLTKEECARYEELAIFPKSTSIPLSTVARLWKSTSSLSPSSSRRLCEKLFKLSLVTRLDLSYNIELHDILLDYLAARTSIRIASVHHALLHAHWPSSGWKDLPLDEPYLWSWLFHHLLGARLTKELTTTAKSLVYLAKKAWVQGAPPVEADLARAAEVDTSQECSILLTNFVQASHLVEACTDLQELLVTLHGRLLHLSFLLDTALEEDLTPPYLILRTPPPDRPADALRRVLRGQIGSLTSCAMDDAGSTILASGDKGQLALWRNFAKRLILDGNQGRITCCDLSCDGNIAVSGSEDHSLKVWDCHSGKELFGLLGHTGKVTDCRYWTDNIFVSASTDKTLRIWDAENGRELIALLAQSAVTCCAVAGGIIIAGCGDRNLRVWRDLRNNPVVVTMSTTWPIQCCDLSSDGHYAAIGTGNTVLVLDLVENKYYGKFEMKSLAESCSITPTGTLVAASFDSSIWVWKLDSEIPWAILTGHEDIVRSCVISDHGGVVVSCASNGEIRVWEPLAHPRAKSESIDLWFKQGFSSCSVSPDGRRLLTSAGNDIICWNLDDIIPILTLEGHSGQVNSIAFNVNGKVAVSGAKDKTIKIWNTENWQLTRTLEGHQSEIRDCAVDASGLLVLSAAGSFTLDSPGELKLWNASSGSELVELYKHEKNPAFACSMTPDALYIMFATWGHIFLFNVAAKKLESIMASDYPFLDCEISAEGSLVVAANKEGLFLSRLSEGKAERFPMRGDLDGASSCTISRDGKFVAMTSGGSLEIWSTSDCRRLAAIQVTSNLYACSWSDNCQRVVAVGPRGVYFLRFVDLEANRR